MGWLWKHDDKAYTTHAGRHFFCGSSSCLSTSLVLYGQHALFIDVGVASKMPREDATGKAGQLMRWRRMSLLLLPSLPDQCGVTSSVSWISALLETPSRAADKVNTMRVLESHFLKPLLSIPDKCGLSSQLCYWRLPRRLGTATNAYTTRSARPSVSSFCFPFQIGRGWAETNRDL
jgi:hypothetical protein